MKAPDTKTILNITLVIAIVVVGKKIGEKFGLFKTTDDTTAATLDTGSTADTTDTSVTAPVGLSLNPNYWKNITINIIKPKLVNIYGKDNWSKHVSSNLYKLSGIEFTTNNVPSIYTFDNLIKLLAPPYAVYSITKQINEIAKVKKLNILEQAYAVLCFKIYDSKGVLYDEPDKLNGVLNICNSKFQTSYLSYVFFKMYDKDLISFLNTYMNSVELTKVYNILKNKPFALNYIKP